MTQSEKEIRNQKIIGLGIVALIVASLIYFQSHKKARA